MKTTNRQPLNIPTCKPIAIASNVNLRRGIMDAMTSAAIAKRVQPDPSNPKVIYRVWTPSDMAYIVVDVFIEGLMEDQHVHNPTDGSYFFWRSGLLSGTRYPAWQW